nr:MAG TPA: hypothetical protein [Caudoviricetes sp.]
MRAVSKKVKPIQVLHAMNVKALYLQRCRAFFDAGRGKIPGKIKRCLCQ